MNMRGRWLWMAPAAIAGMAVFGFIGGQIVMRLWNWLLPPLFAWHSITFWQALGLLALCRILFGGLGIGGRGYHRRTPEERERLRQKMREHFGFSPRGGENAGN
jgi:hypothetical protein